MLCNILCSRKNDSEENLQQSSNTEKIVKQKVYSVNHHNWFLPDVILLPKDFNYVITILEKCIKHCSNSQVNLKYNPPYLSGTLRNFQSEVLGIIKFYESNIEELSKIFFFKVLIWTLVKHCKEILRLFRNSKIAIINNEASAPRQKLVQISLLLSHLLHALMALFPNQYYAPELFRITKSDAAEWWHSHFGQNTTVVEWKDFFHVFSKLNYISEVSQISALRQTISITGNGFVSIYDFDVFVRLFGPWSSIVECWRRIALEHPGCLSLITYEQAVRILTVLRWRVGPGSYVFRFSCTRPGQWAIGYIDNSGDIYQTIVQNNKSIALALTEGYQAGIYRYPNGQYNYDNSLLYSLLKYTKNLQQPLQNIQVTKEQHEAYCRIDSSFELCKICSQNNKNIQLEPCGHLLCNLCLQLWEKSFPNHTCPFCRLEIKGMETVSVIPFSSSNSSPNSETRWCISTASSGASPPLVPPRLTSTNNISGSSANSRNRYEKKCDNNAQLTSNKKNNINNQIPFGKVNYAQLDWRYKDDDSCEESDIGENDDLTVTLIKSKIFNNDVTDTEDDAAANIIADNAEIASRDSQQSKLEECPLKYAAKSGKHQNMLMSETATSSTVESALLTPSPSLPSQSFSLASHIIKSSSSPLSSNDPIEKLMKITNNDLKMSKEILKYFTPRPIITNS